MCSLAGPFGVNGFKRSLVVSFPFDATVIMGLVGLAFIFIAPAERRSNEFDKVPVAAQHVIVR